MDRLNRFGDACAQGAGWVCGIALAIWVLKLIGAWPL